jgi:hypothetical protein
MFLLIKYFISLWLNVQEAKEEREERIIAKVCLNTRHTSHWRDRKKLRCSLIRYQGPRRQAQLRLPAQESTAKSFRNWTCEEKWECETNAIVNFFVRFGNGGVVLSMYVTSCDRLSLFGKLSGKGAAVLFLYFREMRKFFETLFWIGISSMSIDNWLASGCWKQNVCNSFLGNTFVSSKTRMATYFGNSLLLYFYARNCTFLTSVSLFVQRETFLAAFHCYFSFSSDVVLVSFSLANGETFP